MASLRRWLLRVFHHVRPDAAEADLTRELQAHLTLLQDECERRGLTPDEARTEARRTLGGVEQTKELHRDARAIRWLTDIRRDVQYAVRTLRRSPAFTAIAILSIAFGTGANVGVFSALDALILRPPAVTHPGELLTVGVEERLAVMNVRHLNASYPDYLDLRERARSFSGLVGFVSRAMALSVDPSGAPTVHMVTMVSADIFRVLGVEPALGRGFHDDEGLVPGRDAVAVLSFGTWQTQFAADPAILGRTIKIAGVDFTVIGVAPERFRGVQERYIRDPIYVPLMMWPRIAADGEAAALDTRDLRLMELRGRLRPGVSVAAANTELATIGESLEAEYPKANAGRRVMAWTHLQRVFASDPVDVGLMLVATMLSMSVLAVACANVAGLLSSRAPARAREIALRLAIGAGRARLIRQLLTESALIALAGSAGGILVGQGVIKLLSQIRYPTNVVALPVFELDQRALAFSLAMAVLSAFIFGLGPAIETTRVELVRALKASDAAAGRRQRLTARSFLVAAQVALSLVVATVAVFAFQVFGRQIGGGMGFRNHQMVRASVDATQARFSRAETVQYFDRAAAAVKALPGVDRVALTSGMPLMTYSLGLLVPEGHKPPPGQSDLSAWTYNVDESYFETMEMPILDGRGVLASDTSTALRIVVVNETLARHYWPGERAIGKRIHVGGADGPWAEVVGVARAAKYLYFAETPQDALFFSFRQADPTDQMVIVAQSAGDSASIVEPIRAAVNALNRDVPVFEVQTIEDFYAISVTGMAGVMLRLVAWLGVMGVTLAMIGLYGLVSYAVSRRTREMGIRIAVGADYGRLLRMVLRQGLTPAWWGLTAGLFLAAATGYVLPRYIFPVEQRADPGMFVLVAVSLLVVAVGAAFLPARRAARVNPVEALRTE
jgi:putative ABC transport system permease protein